MKNILPSLLLAAAFLSVAAGCGTSNKPGETNVESGVAKSIVPKEGAPAASQDSVVAGLHRDAAPPPTGEQLYDRANKAVDRNHDGKADH